MKSNALTYELKSLPTFDLFSQLAALVFRVVHNWRGGRRSETILLHLAPVPLLSGQHALAAFPLVKIVSGLCKVHMEATCVFFVRAGAQPDTVTYTMISNGLKSVRESSAWPAILIQNETLIVPSGHFECFCMLTEASTAFYNNRKKKNKT